MTRLANTNGRTRRPFDPTRWMSSVLGGLVSLLVFGRRENLVAARLDEAQRHAIRLADCQVLFAILVLEFQRRRQCPHAFRIILGVLRVGVDFALLIELE